MLAAGGSLVLRPAHELFQTLGRVALEDLLAAQLDDLVAQDRGPFVVEFTRGDLHLALELLDQPRDLLGGEIGGRRVLGGLLGDLPQAVCDVPDRLHEVLRCDSALLVVRGLDDAATLVQVFKGWGLDAEIVQTGNGLWAVTITRDDGKVVCVNDDAVGLYEGETKFYEGTESQVIVLC